MLNQIKNYVKSLKVIPIKSLITVYGSNNVNSYSPNYYIKFLTRHYSRDNLLKHRSLSLQNTVQQNKNISSGCYNVWKSHHHKNLIQYSGKSRISLENMAQSEYNIFQSCVRYYSTENNEKRPEVKEKMLMDYPLIVWPSFFNSVRLWFIVYFIIKPYYEMDFSVREFCQASKQAFVKVSTMLSQGNFNTLTNFIDANALDEIKRNFSALSVKERLDFEVTFGDIFFYFPYQAGLIFKNDGQSSDRVFLEITMCFHIFRGFSDYIEKGENSDPRSLYDKEDRISIANYRFIREITKGANDEWNINVVNYFKPRKLAARF